MYITEFFIHDLDKRSQTICGARSITANPHRRAYIMNLDINLELKSNVTKAARHGVGSAEAPSA